MVILPQNVAHDRFVFYFCDINVVVLDDEHHR
jgi:hypothetical protein